MASSLSSSPCNKGFHCVKLIHEKNGLVKFTSTIETDITIVDVTLFSSSEADNTTHKILNKTLFKWKDAVFFEILWYGLKKHGAICLDGWTQKTNPRTQKQTYFPAIRTVVQLDGDIICQISKELLKEHKASNFIKLYQQVISKFLDQFQTTLDKRVKFIRAAIITISSIGGGGLTLWFFL